MICAGLVTLLLVIAACQSRAQLPPADAPYLYNDTHCGHECIRCAPDGCIKCARMLVWPAGTCASSCPSGTRESWASDDRLMGRVCYPSRAYNEALVGGACGAALCIVLLIAAAAYAKCRSKRPQRQPLPQSRDEDDAKLRDFHKQLDCLRPHAYTLLAILNHTRHQVRELYQLGNNNAAIAYSCVLSDLAKLLILLNKQQVPVVPDEWPRLASWADKILKRYSRMTLVNQQEGQLVNFLPSPHNQDGSSNSTQQSFSTFKPPSYSPSSYNSNNFDKDFDGQCDWSDHGRPPSYSQIEQANETMVLSDPWERRPIVRRESVWLEDELFEMTRRPQDELTTEL